MANVGDKYVCITGLASRLKKMATFYDEEFAKDLKLPDNVLITPKTPYGSRIKLHFLEFERLIDSANMHVSDYTTIAKTIETHYKNYDGFVILHGTDTMAYTASALSFMLENLNKTVILTGS